MQKQIHVNSYVKRDGTQVKEHFRNIDTDYYVTAPVLQGGVSECRSGFSLTINSINHL